MSRLPIRLRLTLVFALAMAVVLSAFGAFVYVRLDRDLLASVDMGLLARGQGLADGLQSGTAVASNALCHSVGVGTSSEAGASAAGGSGSGGSS